MPSLVVKNYDARGLQRIGRLPIATGQTWKAGDWLAVNSSGQLISAIAAGVGNDMAAWSAGIVNLVAGRAIEDAQPAAGDPTILPATKLFGTFIIAEPGTQFRLALWSGTAANAYPNANQIGAQYNFTYQTITGNSIWAVNLDTTNKPKLQVVDHVPDFYQGWPDIGQASAPSTGTLSQYADAWVEFLGGACLLSGARPLTRTN